MPESDITLHHLNDGSQGISSDGITIWVAQFASPKFFAYSLATGAYDPFQRISTGCQATATHVNSGRIGTTLYVFRPLRSEALRLQHDRARDGRRTERVDTKRHNTCRPQFD